ncbi:hypothetical protein D3C73_1481030 [compost metagenome]
MGVTPVDDADIAVRRLAEDDSLGPGLDRFLQYILQAEADQLDFLHRLAAVFLGKMVNLHDKHCEILLRQRNVKILPAGFRARLRCPVLHQEG